MMVRIVLISSVLLLFCLTSSLAKSLTFDEEPCSDPAYACKGFAEAHACGAVTPCIKDVWEKLKLPQDNNEVCDICKEMVKEARDQLQSNETQEELKEVFEGSCNLIPIKPIAAACRQVVDQLIPQLVEMLASEMDPNTVCTVSGLCNGNIIAKILEGKHLEHIPVSELVQVSAASRKCGICKIASSVLKSFIASSSSKDIEHFLLDVCKKEFPGTECEQKVAEYWPLIYIFLKESNPEAMCQSVHVCEASENGVNTLTPPVQSKDELTCEFCESVLSHVKDMITSNSTVEQFRTALLNFCKVLGSFKDECTQLVDEYYDKFFAFIRDDLNPQAMCTMMGLCQSGVKSPSSIPLTKIGPAILAGDKTQMWAKIIPAHIISSLGPEVSVFPPDTNYKKDKYNLYQKSKDEGTSESNSVHHISLSKPALLKEDFKCDLCEDVVTLVRKEISRNETEEKVREELLKVCGDLPSSMQQQCQEFVNSYVDMLIKLIGEELEPETVCREMGLCHSGFVGLLSLRKPPIQVPLLSFAANDVNCELCKQVAKWLETELQDNRTQEAIRVALDKVCSVLPSSVKDDCVKFVDQYTSTLVTILEDELDPDMVCEIIGLCKGSSKRLKGITCTVCQDVLHYVQTLLMDPKYQLKLKQVLEKGCKDLPSALQSNCVAFVDEYGSAIFAILAQEIDPAQLCEEGKLCQHGEKPDKELLIKHLELDTCDLCITVVDYVDKLLEDDDVDHDITKMIEKVCNAIPASAKDKCISLLEAYGPYILQMIGQTANSKQVCRAFDLCRPTPGQVHLLGGKKCTFGPSYWCMTKAHATACKAEKFCTGIWESRKKV